jgi:CubicO group peptidase (beta-lactamase class C family)
MLQYSLKPAFKIAVRLGAAIIFMLAGHAAFATPTFDPVRVEGYVDGLMRAGMERYDVAGATIAVVQDGRVLLAKGYGQARITPRARATDTDTLFQVASTSKIPTYMAIMQLVEAGKLGLDDPVNAHLPADLRIPDQGFRKPILIAHLMSHSAGFEDTEFGHDMINAPQRLMPIHRFLARYRPDRVREAGVQAAYSNYSVVLLGAVIEHETGMDFPTYMEIHILRPLGMTRSTYRDPYSAALGKRLGLPAPMDARVAQNITQQLGGTIRDWRELGPEYMTMLAPAGALRASANDMARFVLALSDPARLEAAGVLKASTFAEMMKPTLSMPVTTRHGFLNYRFQGGREGFGHGGTLYYGDTEMVIVPDLKLGIFVSTNGTDGDAITNNVARRILSDFAPLPETATVRTPEIKALARELGGDWMLNRRSWHRTEAAFNYFAAGLTVTSRKNGDLMVGSFIGNKSKLEPMGKGVWQSAGRDKQLFLAAKDAEGRMELWHGSGAVSASRAGLFQHPLHTLIVFILTVLSGTVVALGGVRHFWRAAPAGRFERYASRSVRLAGFAWAAGLAGFLAILVQALADKTVSLNMNYPGPVFYIAWIVALAVVLTLAALPGLAVLGKSGRWTRWRKARHAALLLLFCVAAVYAWQIGLVGYSGFA